MAGDVSAEITDALQRAIQPGDEGATVLRRLMAVLDPVCPEIERVWLGVEMGHPSLVGVAWIYRKGGGVVEQLIQRDITQTAAYLKSPVKPVKERLVDEIRVPLGAEAPPSGHVMPKGSVSPHSTDYVALSLPTRGSRDDVITFTTRARGGFTEADLEVLRAVRKFLILPVALASDQLLNWTLAGAYGSDTAGISAPISGLEEGLLTPYDPSNPADRKILDDVAMSHEPFARLATPVWLFHARRYQIVWANDAALEVWKADSLEDAWKRDFVTSMSEAMAHNIANVMLRIQGGQKVLEWAVLEPLGHPRRHCLVHHQGWLSDGEEVVVTEALKEPPAEQILDLAANLSLTLGLYDREGALVSCNPAYLKLLGEAAIGLGDLLREGWDLSYFISSLTGLDAHSVELPLRTSKGTRWFRVDLRKVHSVQKEEQVLASFFDITEHRLEKQELQRLARTDVLTEVSNRHGVMSDAEGWLTEGQLEHLVFLDLDGLKMVNDVHGHAFGDRILQNTARRIVGAAGKGSLVGRMGGDEFLVALAHEDLEVGERIRAALAQPFDVDGVHLSVTASVGVVHCAEDTGSMEELLSHADMAMQGAKRTGKNRVLSFASDMVEASQRHRELNRHVRGALAAGEIRLVVQPIFDLRTGRVARAECLMRWTSSALGVVPPNEFIPAAEEAGNIADLGRFALESACRIAREVRSVTGQWIPHAVNVSARELIDPYFSRDLQEVVKAAQVPPSALVIEMTETSLINRLDLASKTLETLQNMGFSVALDDFGTGYSSLSYLHHLSFDSIKLDRSLIMDLPGHRSSAILSALVELADRLGVSLVGEGIETEAQRDALVTLGCGFGQGYLFARPLEVDGWLEFLLSQ